MGKAVKKKKNVGSKALKLANRLETMSYRWRATIYSGALFVILSAWLLIVMPNPNSSYFEIEISSFFVLDYSMGICSRMFIGSVVSLFTDFVSRNMLTWLSLVITIITTAEFSIYIGQAVARTRSDRVKGMAVFILLFIVNPFGLVYYFYPFGFGRFEIFLLMLTVSCLFLTESRRLCWLIPLVCIIAMAIYQAFVFLLFPAVALALFYLLAKDGINKKIFILCAATAISVVLAFLYFQFGSQLFSFARINYDSFLELARDVSERSDIEFDKPHIFSEYFATPSEWYGDVIVPITKNFCPEFPLVLVAVSAPLVAAFIFLWTNAFRAAQTGIKKLFFLACLLAPLSVVPAFIMANDWDRWLTSAFLCQFLTLFMLIRAGDEETLCAAWKISGFFIRHKIVLVLLAIGWITVSATKVNIVISYIDHEVLQEHVIDYYAQFN